MTTPDRRWPRRVYGAGTDPDPRFSLANERTFLAWVRTSLALLAGAAAVHVVDLGVRDVVAATLSVLLAVAALGCVAGAWSGWVRTERAMRTSAPLPSNVAGAVLAVVVALAAVAMLVIGARG
ncbi:hypothetical protein GCM10009821_07990 [Aeromicrobium halocynthiae]|uniref:DUF202 domain-containing protein n=1 Tax=Aeromicrobium halocynthiae TaxID=560557 RepID=A0ABN2VUB0_9ACTN